MPRIVSCRVTFLAPLNLFGSGSVVGGAVTISLVEPLIVWVKSGNRYIDNSHFTDGSMTTSRLDQDRGAGADRVQFTIEFHLATPLQDIIDLSQFTVVVSLGIRANIDNVQRGCLIGVLGESSSRFTARAFNGFDLVGVDQLEKFIWRKGAHGFVVMVEAGGKKSDGLKKL